VIRRAREARPFDNGGKGFQLGKVRTAHYVAALNSPRRV
jgi:hypothetical protein